MIFNSIRWRLQAWHGFLLVCLVTGLLSGFYVFVQQEKLQAVDDELTEAVTPLLPRFAPPGGRNPEGRPPVNREPGMRPPRNDGPPRPEEESPPPPGMEPRRPVNPRPGEGQPLELREREERFFASGKMYYIVWGESGGRLAAATNAPMDLAKPGLGSPVPGRILRTRDTARELIQFAPNGRCVLVGTSLTPTLAQMRQLGFALALLGFGIVVAGFAVGWWLATRALRPIEEISRTARDISAGDLSQRINASETESELGQLAAVLNSTFARLDTAFTQQKQFTSDAAHELRTPVAVILTQVQSTLNKERSGAEYRETLEACQRAATRMKKLVESLLELARLDAGQAAGRREPLDLSRCAADCVALIQPLAEERKIQLHSELTAAPCVGDADQLALVITNLLTNAIHYNRGGGEVRIKTRLENDTAIVTVTDNGSGIAPEHLPRIFDRFYRADTARTSSQGRTGLGLAITKSIVESHGGRIEVSSEPGKGSSFEVRLPAQ
jgi:two-component system, OmpR family, sensor kinase